MKTQHNHVLPCVAICVFGLLSPLRADIVFLPFSVSGGPDPEFVDQAVLPAELAHAAEFLFGIKKSYPVRSEGASRRTLAQRGLGALWRGGLALGDLRRVCRALDAEYLFTGHAHFEAPRRVRFGARIFGCRAERGLGHAEATESWNRLQATLSELLERVAPFAPDRSGGLVGGGSVRGRVTVLVDASGSMQSNLESIRRGIAALIARLSGDSDLVVYSVRSGAAPRKYGPFRTREAAARELDTLRMGGETTLGDMAAALPVAVRDASGTERSIFVLTDARFNGGDAAVFEAQLRATQAAGVGLRLFEMPGARLVDREAMVRLATALRLPDAVVASGLEARYIDGLPETFVTLGGRVFRARSSVSGDIVRNAVPRGQLEALSAAGADERAVAGSVSGREGRRILAFGQPMSGLEAALEGALLSRSGRAAPGGYRVLVRNRGKAFWIRLSNARDVNALRRIGKRAVYLGLRLSGNQGDEPGLSNHPDFLYLKEQGNVPRLFINEWQHLSRLPPRLVRAEDVWFLLCTVLQVRGAAGTHDD